MVVPIEADLHLFRSGHQIDETTGNQDEGTADPAPHQHHGDVVKGSEVDDQQPHSLNQHGAHEQIALADALGNKGNKKGSNDAADGGNGHNQGNHGEGAKAVNDIIGGDGDASHEGGHLEHHDEHDNEQVFVLHQVFDGVRQGELHRVVNGLDVLLRGEKHCQEHGDGEDAVHHGGHHVAVTVGHLGTCAGETQHQHRGHSVDYHHSGVHADVPGGVDAVALIGILGHHRSKSAVGDVGQGVDHARHHISDGSPDHAAGGGAAEGIGKGQHAHHCQERTAEGDVGAEASPLGAGALCDGAHHGVVDGIPDSGAQHNGGHGHRSQSHNVGVENRQVRAHKGPHELGGQITQAVTDDCGFCGQLLFIHLLSFLSFSCAETHL